MSNKLKRVLCLLTLLFGVDVFQAHALPAQPVPIPEDPSTFPQINISGVGIGTLGYGKNAETPSGKGSLNFSDSSLQIGAAQSLFGGGAVGSMGVGWLTIEESNKGNGNQIFLHQAFVDYQSENFEALIGRSDNPTAHLVDFPTLRGDDLITLTNPMNPFSNGENAEEHRYSNTASVTFNQNFKYFENIHVQHLINSADPNADDGLNSFGATFQYLGEPGLESFELLPAWGMSYERISLNSSSSNGLNQASLGGTLSLNTSVVNRIELSLQNIYSWGSNLNAFSNITDSFEADSNAIAASLRYLHAPFGKPGFQLALTAGYKNYSKVNDANSFGMALTGVKRLGSGFDFVAQYQGQWRTAVIAAVQSHDLKFEQKAEVGFAFNFDTALNEHIAPRRSLLNQRHHYISN